MNIQDKYSWVKERRGGGKGGRGDNWSSFTFFFQKEHAWWMWDGLYNIHRFSELLKKSWLIVIHSYLTYFSAVYFLLIMWMNEVCLWLDGLLCRELWLLLYENEHWPLRALGETGYSVILLATKRTSSCLLKAFIIYFFWIVGLIHVT